MCSLEEGLRSEGQSSPSVCFSSRLGGICAVSAGRGEDSYLNSYLSHLCCPKKSAETGIWERSRTKKGEENEKMKACMGLSGGRSHQSWGGAVDGGKDEQAPLSHSGC